MFKNILRLAMIKKVNWGRQTVTIQMLDRLDGQNRPYECPILHPSALRGSGIFVSPTEGTTVMVDCTYREAPVIVTYLPNSAFSQDLTSSINTSTFLSDDYEYPTLKPGEMAMQGLLGSKLFFNKKGDICFEFASSSIAYTSNDSISTKTSNSYLNTSSSRQISGIIKRDTRVKAKKIESVFDKLSDAKFDNMLTDVGRNPNFSRTTVSSGRGDSEILRNPALVENRELVYEFAIEDNVGSFQDEKDRINNKDIFPLDEPGRRDMSRTDVLNLNPFVPNNLMETVKGTVVDIYGNILDLNRKIIDYNGIDPKAPNRLEVEGKLLRRSIKYHFEINSRKLPTADAGLQEGSFELGDATSSNEPIGYSHSRWSIDVDGEGLTKINIPASTNTGNIPLLTRYSNSNVRRLDNTEIFRDPDTPTLDVLHIGFGEASGDGVGITDTYAPADLGNKLSEDSIIYKTAYHDVASTAANAITTEPISNSISNLITDPEANAGGRSIHMNLDGSMELNIGKDSVDGKSIMQDLAGGIVSRVGKDSRDNSMVSQFDGNIVIQVGGDSIETEENVESPGVTFFVAHKDGFHEIEVNANGIFFRSAPDTSIILDSSKNLVLKSKGTTLLHGENVYIHGTSDDTGSTVTGERLVIRSGTELF